MKRNKSGIQVNDCSGRERGRPGLLLGFTMLLAFGFACVAWPVMAQSDPQPSSSVSETVVIPIEGMTCSACVARVKRTLKAVKGVSEARVSLEKREVELRYETKKTSPEKLAKAIDDLGYKAGTPKKKEKAQ